MATIKIPYSYKQYKDAPLATFVDKHTHKPSSCSFIAMTLGLLIMLAGAGLYNAGGQVFESVSGAIGGVFILFGMIFFILGGMLIPKLSDKFKWSEKIALRTYKKKGLR